jgi:putative phosphoserine phosphatase / 1-acylglycerol-3-phosphate O-acyltransferase
MNLFEHAQLGPPVIAFFDFDGTIIEGESGLICAWPAIRCGFLPLGVVARFAGARALQKLGLKTREQANAVAFECYCGRTQEELRRVWSDLYRDHLRARVSRPVAERLHRHQAAGDCCVVLTLSADFVAEPFAEEHGLERVVGTRMAFAAGLCTGIDGEPLDGIAKLRVASAIATEAGTRLSECAFYSDHAADLPLLEAVGRPVVVGSRRDLVELARRRGWERIAH